MSRCKACNRQIETYDRTTPLNAQILESVYNIDAYASHEEVLEVEHAQLYPTMNDLEGRPEEDLCTSCRTSLIDSVHYDGEYQFEGQYEEL